MNNLLLCIYKVVIFWLVLIAIITFAAWATSPGAQSAELMSVDLNVASRHLDAGPYEYNENNSGVGLTWAADSVYSAGVYRNSYNNTSIYAGRLFQTAGNNLSIGIMVGAVSGYHNITGADVIPMALPFIKLRIRQAGVTLGYLPVSAIGKCCDTMTLQMNLYK